MRAPESVAGKRRGLQVLGGVIGHGLKLGVALALALGAWEAILGAWVFRPAPYHQDADFGWITKPHAVAFTNIEGHATSFYNERGFRDEAITPRKPGEFRVLCLGDSFVEALDVPREQTFEFRLQEMLGKYLQAQDRPGMPRSARVFNAGRSGVTVATAIYFAPQYKKLFDPDLVVVMARDEWRILFDSSEEVRYIPQGEAGSAGFQVKMFNHWETSGAMFRRLVTLGVRELSTVSHGTRQLRLMRSGGGGESDAPQAETPQADAPGAGEKSDDRRDDADVANVEGGPNALKAKAAPDVLERAAAWTPAQLKAAYPKLLVVHVPIAVPQLHGLGPISPTERAFLDGCRAQNIRAIDMRPVIETDFARSQIPPFGFPTTLPWQGHFNAHGHDLTAHALFDSIRDEPQVLEDAPKP